MTYYKIARIVNTFGILGQLKILVDTDFMEERFKIGNILYILDGDKMCAKVQVASFAPHKGAYLVAFEGYNQINQVEGFKGMTLAIAEEDQAELEEGAYYHHQIKGLTVVDLAGTTIGKIKEILTLGSNDVWVVDPKDKDRKDLLLPFIDDVVKDVDLEKGIVTVDILEGLWDED